MYKVVIYNKESELLISNFIEKVKFGNIIKSHAQQEQHKCFAYLSIRASINV